MSFLLAVTAVLFCWALTFLGERALRWTLAALFVASIPGLVFSHLAAPGFELAWLLTIGLLLAGVWPGGGLRGVLIPLAFVAPFLVGAEPSGRWASHTHWSTAALVLLGTALGLGFRGLVQDDGQGGSRGGRVRLVLVACLGVGAAIAALVPSKGPFAWNVLVPMNTEAGVPGRIVTLGMEGADSWPWLEPLALALPAALLLGALSLCFVVVQRDLRTRGVWIGSALSLVVFIAWAGLVWLTPGVSGPLPEIDAARVLEATRPAWVPANAIVYLAPEGAIWEVSRSALALWVALGAALALALRSSQAPASASTGVGGWFVSAAVVFVVAACFLAESWNIQGTSLTAKTWLQVVWFSIAAVMGGAAMFRGTLGAWARAFALALAFASLSFWMASQVIA